MVLVDTISKSSRRLRRENRDSGQQIQKAGSNDISNQPGGVLRVSEVIFQPQTIGTNVQFGETFTTRSGGDGKGSVEMPPLQARPALTSDDAVYPYAYSQRWRQMNVRASEQQTDIDMPNVTNNAGTNQLAPVGVTSAGTVEIDVDRTSGPDGDRVKRTRARGRRNDRNRK